jgi:hypothetical protein
MAETKYATAAEVRAWAKEQNIEVGVRGQLKPAVIDQFNKGRRVKYVVPSKRVS